MVVLNEPSAEERLGTAYQIAELETSAKAKAEKIGELREIHPVMDEISQYTCLSPRPNVSLWSETIEKFENRPPGPTN